ncbi:DUF3108 domain-containing protein [Verrucomicrobiota bacterium]
MKCLPVFIILVFVMLVAHVVCADTNDMWFPVGEKLIYKLYWGVIPVGQAEFSSEWIEENGKQFISLKGRARTGKVVSKIYPVDDFIESVVDAESFLPIRYIQKLKEGRHVRHDKITIDHKSGMACWESKLSQTNRVMKIDGDSRDILSFVYYARSKGYESGQHEKFRVLVDDKIYDLEVTGLSHETRKVKGYGKIKCLKVVPEAKFGEIFVRKGRVQMWFSDDKRRVCVRITAKLKVASLKAILVGVEGPGKDIWVKKDK